MTENQKRYQKSREAYIARAKKWRANNLERHTASCKAWAKKNKTRVSALNKLRGWRRKGIKDISLELYQELHTKQEGVCALCKHPPQGKRQLALDHNHDTGEVRGLLCYACNIGLGHLERLERTVGLEVCKNYIAKTS